MQKAENSQSMFEEQIWKTNTMRYQEILLKVMVIGAGSVGGACDFEPHVRC